MQKKYPILYPNLEAKNLFPSTVKLDDVKNESKKYKIRNLSQKLTPIKKRQSDANFLSTIEKLTPLNIPLLPKIK